jgi:hypothetical protein
MTEVGNMKVYRRKAVVIVSSVFGGDQEFDSGKRVDRETELIDVLAKVIAIKDRVAVDFNHIAAGGGGAKGAKRPMTNWTSVGFGDESAAKIRAAGNLDVNGMGRIHVKGHRDGLESCKRAETSVQVQLIRRGS